MLLDFDALNLSPEPILNAVEAYGGTIIDLDHALVVRPANLKKARSQISRKLELYGMRPGDRVVMAVGNGPLFIASLTAVLAGGGAPLLVHAMTPPVELIRTGLRFGARFVLCDAWDASSADGVSSEVKTIGNTQSWVRLFLVEIDQHDPAFESRYPALPGVPLHPTSGTTGQPKVAVRPAERAVAEAVHYIETIGIGGCDTLLATAPMSHAYAYGMCVMVPLITGANVLTMRRFAPKLVFRAIEQHEITILPAVPAMLDVLMFGAGDRLRHLARCVLTAGAPLPERTAERFKQASGVIVRPLYGTTETGGISVADAADNAMFGDCVGRPMNGVAVKVASDPSTTGLEEGVGRLLVRSSSMMAGYLGHDGIDTSPLVDGWFVTGDLARLDADGTIHLVGRETEVINVGGMKVVPGEVEEVIALLPEVSEVKVYWGCKRSGSQFVKAAVAGTPELQVEKIRAHCERQLVYYKRPQSILLVDALPRSAAGKIVRDQLP